MSAIVNKGRRSKLHHWETMDTVVTIIAIFALFITLYPVWYIVCMSISDPVAANAGKVKFWPVGINFKSFEIVGQDMQFWRAFRNSILYVIAGCILMLFNTITVSFPLTRPNLKGRKFLNLYLLIPMYFGGGMIPSFILYTKLGLYNTPWALILPGYSIWNIILCRTYLKSLPEELSEAAYIDGANNIQVLWKIILPLSMPVLAVILIYTIVGVWNSWFGASIYTTRKEIQPVQLFLRNLLDSMSSGMTRSQEGETGLTKEIMEEMAKMAMNAQQLKYAMLVIVTLPILMVYPMFQKHFTKGVMLGSLKG